MRVMPHEVLQPDTGRSLPPPVRRSLLAMGITCNTTAIHVHQAQSNLWSIEATAEAQQAAQALLGAATSEPGQADCGGYRHAAQALEDLSRIAAHHYDPAIIVPTGVMLKERRFGMVAFAANAFSPLSVTSIGRSTFQFAQRLLQAAERTEIEVGGGVDADDGHSEFLRVSSTGP